MYHRKKTSIDHSGTSVSSFFGTRGRDNMRLTLMDLFLAGSDTTAATMDWAVMWICKHPDVSARMKEEINSVIGKDRTPSLTDRH